MFLLDIFVSFLALLYPYFFLDILSKLFKNNRLLNILYRKRYFFPRKKLNKGTLCVSVPPGDVPRYFLNMYIVEWNMLKAIAAAAHGYNVYLSYSNDGSSILWDSIFHNSDTCIINKQNESLYTSNRPSNTIFKSKKEINFCHSNTNVSLF